MKFEDITLGAQVVDKLDGSVGTVTAKAEYLHGSPQISVKPVNPEHPNRWVDPERLENESLENHQD